MEWVNRGTLGPPWEQYLVIVLGLDWDVQFTEHCRTPHALLRRVVRKECRLPDGGDLKGDCR